MEKKSQRTDVYEIVNNRIIEQLEQNIVPWQKPWTTGGLPKNLISKRAYRGINVWLLALSGYAQNLFLTYKQIMDVGGKIKKGEKGHLVVFWKKIEVPDKESAEIKYVSFLRYHLVFNISQCLDIPDSLVPNTEEKNNDPIKICEEIVNGMPQKPDIRHKEQKAYYHTVEDYVNMPKMNTFEDSESYYGTLFHELVHSTGHASRVYRKELAELKPFGSPAYSVEELTAEIGACYLKSFAGIATKMENNVAYLQGWLKKLKSDRKFIVSASAQAQRAADFILNVNYEEKPKESLQEVTGDKEEEDVIF